LFFIGHCFINKVYQRRTTLDDLIFVVEMCGLYRRMKVRYGGNCMSLGKVCELVKSF